MKNLFFAAINIYQGLINSNTTRESSGKGFTYRFSSIFIAVNAFRYGQRDTLMIYTALKIPMVLHHCLGYVSQIICWITVLVGNTGYENVVIIDNLKHQIGKASEIDSSGMRGAEGDVV